MVRLVGFNSLVHSLRALSALRRSGLRTASTAAKPCQGDSLEFYLITARIPTVAAAGQKDVNSQLHTHSSNLSSMNSKKTYNTASATLMLYTSSLLNAACKKALNLLKKGLLIRGEAVEASKRRRSLLDHKIQLLSKGSSEGSGIILEVPDEPKDNSCCSSSLLS
nr:hypothetical protein [Tanacetum cinerariifolium]